MELNDLKDSLTALKYGEIATVAMIDRGAYAEIEESIEAESKDQKINSGISPRVCVPQCALKRGDVKSRYIDEF